MDYLITDENLIKKGEEKFYSEKLIYMPDIWNSLSKPKNLPEIVKPKQCDHVYKSGSSEQYAEKM